MDSKASPPSHKGRAGSPHYTSSGPAFGPAPPDSTASAPYRTPLPLVEVPMTPINSGPVFPSNCSSTVRLVPDPKFSCICPHKSSMGHLIRWESLFFFQIPHKSSMGHLFRCGFFHLFFSHRFSYKSSMGRLSRCGSSVLLFWISLKSSMGRLSRCGSSILFLSDFTQALYWVTCSLLYMYMYVCV